MLSDYRVLDLTDERGALCGQLLADLGAEVLKIEPPGGCALRESTLAWEIHARNCGSVVVDFQSAVGQARFAELLADADLLLAHDAGIAGSAIDDLLARQPRLVVATITPFGTTGPKRDYVATDLIAQAASGAMAITGFDDAKPLRTGCISAWSHAGVAAAGGALLALRSRDRTGRGQHVDVSAQLACTLAASYSLLTAFVGASRMRRASDAMGGGIPFIWRAKDGFVSLTLGFAGPMLGFARQFIAWLKDERAIDDELAALDWPTYLGGLRSGGDPGLLRSLLAHIGAFLAARTKAELLAGALEYGTLIVPVSSTQDLLDSAQLRERECFWRSNGVVFPGAFARFGAKPIALRNAAPALPAAAAHAARRPRGTRVEPGPSSLPLAGVNVLDFSWVMAGPWSTRVMADYGATVVKIESRTRLDLVRILGPFYDDKLTPESSASFASINAGKRSCEVDPNTPEGKATIFELVDWADVVVESFSPRAMKKWGLDYPVLSARKPSIVMLSTCLFGQTGPHATMAGYGTMGAAMGGLVLPTGLPDRAPCGPFGPYTDYVAPRFSVVALLAALHHRDRTGEGQHIDQSQAESAMQFLSLAIAQTSVGGPTPDRLANSDPAMSPHDVYRCAGEDQWVAIAVRDARDWRALVAEMGDDALRAARLDSIDERRRAANVIDAAIAAWTKSQTPSDVEARLQRRKVPAHAVVNAGAPPDAQLVHREHFVRTAHAVRGEGYVESTGYRFSSMAARVGRVPSLGGDTEWVSREILRR